MCAPCVSFYLCSLVDVRATEDRGAVGIQELTGLNRAQYTIAEWKSYTVILNRGTAQAQS